MNKSWIRILQVTLISTKLGRQLTFGSINQFDGWEPTIEVKGYKYIGFMKDNCTVTISNLDYSKIVEIMSGEYFDIRIDCGYKNGSIFTVFKGSVLYISNNVDNRETNVVTILCGSELLGRFSKNRLKLNFNNGVNLYSAIEFMCRLQGIKQTSISTNLKTRFIEEIMNVNDNSSGFLETLMGLNGAFVGNSDASLNATFSFFDASKSSHRLITLGNNMIDITNGHPHLNEDGLTLTVSPTQNYLCTDVIKIDNSIIGLEEVTSINQLSKMYGMYLDKDGQYMIYQIQYALENRGSAFSFNLTCKSRALISKLNLGGTT